MPVDALEDEFDHIQFESFNYFNYFTEVEEEFVRRRGAHMMISPLDWALVESWKNVGMPLHVVLRGINQAFDSYEAQAKRRPNKRRVNHMFYCEQAVEEAFAEYKLSQVGGAPTQQSPPAEEGQKKPKRFEKAASTFTKEALLAFIDSCRAELDLAAGGQLPSQLQELLDRAGGRLSEIRAALEAASAVDPEALEDDLDSLDRLLLEGVKAATSEEEQERVRAEAKSQLRRFRKKMDKTVYEQTVENFVARRLRETHHLPRLSLFFMT